MTSSDLIYALLVQRTTEPVMLLGIIYFVDVVENGLLFIKGTFVSIYKLHDLGYIRTVTFAPFPKSHLCLVMQAVEEKDRQIDSLQQQVKAAAAEMESSAALIEDLQAQLNKG